jgi:release factor glutamine methyltransferase
VTHRLGGAWRQIRDRFRTAGLDTAELDAKLLASFALGVPRSDLTLRADQAVAADALARLDTVAARRLAGEPVARIIGEQEFYGLKFQLNAATLVPRPETELLVDLAIQALAGREAPTVLDLGTGSGCVAIAILARVTGARAVAVDLSAEALIMASANARRHGAAARLALRQGSWFDPIGSQEHFDVIASNPPYIESDEIGGLMAEVRDNDPLLALDGGSDGLDAYRTIVPAAAAALAPGGALMLEIGSRQAEAVAALCRDAGFGTVRVEKDLAGLDRVVVAHHIR